MCDVGRGDTPSGGGEGGVSLFFMGAPRIIINIRREIKRKIIGGRLGVGGVGGGADKYIQLWRGITSGVSSVSVSWCESRWFLELFGVVVGDLCCEVGRCAGYEI